MSGPTLVTFLGTKPYAEVAYAHGGRLLTMPYFACAAARFFSTSQVTVLATDTAWEANGEAFIAAGQDLGLAVTRRPIPQGETESELWGVFDTLLESLSSAVQGVVLDITHGFRHLPFFAAACAAFLRADGRLPEVFTVIYAAMEARQEEGPVPVWELTPFLDLLDWSQAVKVFTETGFADNLLNVMRRQDARYRKMLSRLPGKNSFPRTSKLSGALERFANDFATVRIAAMVRDVEPQRSSAGLLRDAIDGYGEEAAEALPPLKPLLRRLRDFCADLVAPSLHGDAADRALCVLARRYATLHRYPEAMITVREGWVSRYAEAPSQTEAGLEIFDPAARAVAERAWISRCDQARTIAEIRNDIEHGGYRHRPLPGHVLRRRIEKEVVDRFADSAPDGDAVRALGTVWFVTRHPGAVEWARRRGLAIDRQITHLDPALIQPGDTVIGTLPVHLAAEVCQRGARYLHLSLDLPPQWRGQELSAGDLDRFNARLEEYYILRIGGEPADS